jgi:uncharacterized protein (TIGR03086 family)
MPATAEVIGRYGRIADGFDRRLRGVTHDQWTSATPCDQWTARDLVAHVVRVHQQVGANVGGPSPSVNADADLVAQWVQARAVIASALADERAEQIIGGMFGEQSFESLVSRLLCADTLVHTWDLARATGQDERLDDDACARALSFLEAIGDGLRRPGGFGASIDPPGDADIGSKLLCFCGRDPSR